MGTSVVASGFHLLTSRYVADLIDRGERET